MKRNGGGCITILKAVKGRRQPKSKQRRPQLPESCKALLSGVQIQTWNGKRQGRVKGACDWLPESHFRLNSKMIGLNCVDRASDLLVFSGYRFHVT